MKHNSKEVDYDSKGCIAMTPHTIRVLCIKDELYELPELNEKLYLHFKGFGRISGLEEYYNVKTLWLENNAIRVIEGLEFLPSLSFLFLQQNFVTEISGLSMNKKLHTLNLSHNKIKVIRGLEELVSLEHLNISSNFVEVDGLNGLLDCPSLTNVDISENLIENKEGVLEIFQGLPALFVLSLKGNKFVRETSNYRKSSIAALPLLKHLDDRPIFPEERRTIEAWAKGGLEAERREKELIIEEKRVKQREYVEGLKANDELRKAKRKEYILKVISEIEVKLQLLISQRESGIFANGIKSNLNEIELTQAELNKLRTTLEQVDSSKIKDFKYEIGKIQSNSPIENRSPLQPQLNESLNKKWNEELLLILDAMLVKSNFDFESVISSFNEILVSEGHQSTDPLNLKCKWIEFTKSQSNHQLEKVELPIQIPTTLDELD